MGTPEQPPIRIGNEEREAAVAELGEHFAHGRLETEEYSERVAQAYCARTARELHDLFVDLPGHAVQAQHHPFPPQPHPGYPPAVVWAPPQPAPYGWDPVSGRPFSDRSKVVAGVLQLFLPFGVGRLYSGHVGLGIVQFLACFVFGIGVLWCWIDGIALLAGRPTDPYGRPLRN